MAASVERGDGSTGGGATVVELTVAESVVELQAAKKKVPMPGKDDPAKTLEIAPVRSKC